MAGNMSDTTAAAQKFRFRRNILRITTGSILSQGLVIAAMPLLTRLYPPDDFGALAVFTAIHALVAALFTLKYDLSIVLPRDTGPAVELTFLTVAVSSLLSILLLVVLGASRFWIGSPQHWYYFLLPLSAVLTAANTCAQQWSARASDYRRFAHSQMLNAVVNIGAALVLAWVVAMFSGGLVVAYVAALAAATFYLSSDFQQVVKRTRQPWPGLRVLLHTASEYRRFPLLVLPSSLMATASMAAPPFVLQATFSLREVGYYAIASRLLLTPTALIGGAVNEAFRAEFVERLKLGGDVAAFFRYTLRRLILFALPVFVVLFAIAPTLFAILFGPEYRNSGVLSRYLCLGALAQFVSQPFSCVFVVTGSVRKGLIVQTAMTAAPLAGLLAGAVQDSMERALLFSSIATLGCGILLVALAHRCCKRSNGCGVAIGSHE